MSILISCCFHALVDHRIMPNFPFYLFPISSDCWNFTTSTRPSSRHFPISAQTSFASSIVRQSEIFTDKAIPESKLSYTWVKYISTILKLDSSLGLFFWHPGAYPVKWQLSTATITVRLRLQRLGSRSLVWTDAQEPKSFAQRGANCRRKWIDVVTFSTLFWWRRKVPTITKRRC